MSRFVFAVLSCCSLFLRLVVRTFFRVLWLLFLFCFFFCFLVFYFVTRSSCGDAAVGGRVGAGGGVGRGAGRGAGTSEGVNLVFFLTCRYCLQMRVFAHRLVLYLYVYMTVHVNWHVLLMFVGGFFVVSVDRWGVVFGLCSISAHSFLVRFFF